MKRLQKRLKKAQQTIRRLRNEIHNLKEQTRRMAAKFSGFSFVKTPQRRRGPGGSGPPPGEDKGQGAQGGRHMTTVGGYRLALKRCRGYMSTSDATDTFELPCSRQTVAWWETALAANLVLASRSFYEGSDTAIRQAHAHAAERRSLVSSWEVHRIIGDATNCTAARKLKAAYPRKSEIVSIALRVKVFAFLGQAHVLHISSRYRIGIPHESPHDDTDDADPESAGPGAPGPDAVDTDSWGRDIMPDLALVPPKCGGLEARALYFRQMASVGAPIWLCAARVGGGSGGSGWDAGAGHIRVMLFVSDAGSDQRECAELIEIETVGDPLMLVLRQFCALHQLHLVVKKTLEKDPTYLRKLATLCNTWRAAGNTFNIFQAWKEVISEPEARHKAFRLPPRPLKGRWGAIVGCEKYFLACGMDDTRSVFQNVFGEASASAPRRRRRRKGNARASELEDALAGSIEDAETYTETVGRWVWESLLTTCDKEFWAKLHLQHLSRGPASKALNSIQKSNRMDALVTHVVPTAMVDFDEVIADGSASTVWADMLQLIEPEQQHHWLRDAMCACIGVACDFWRRLAFPCLCFPRKLVWLVRYGEPGEYSPEEIAATRAAICT